MKRLRRITEAEVIAGFLQAEHYQPEYEKDREKYRRMVEAPDLANETENAIRRALLFRRRATMWRELPEDPQWWEVELEPHDLDKIRVFPRAQWRSISSGSFSLSHIVERIRAQIALGIDNPLTAKIRRLLESLQEDGPRSTVLLIGVDEYKPLTLLEGNHRFVAATLMDPETALSRFRLICGLSQRMSESCWYHTNFANLWHYMKNRLRNIVDHEANVERVPLRKAPAAHGPVPLPNVGSKSK
jgi:hypothetical protein